MRILAGLICAIMLQAIDTLPKGVEIDEVNANVLSFRADHLKVGQSGIKVIILLLLVLSLKVLKMAQLMRVIHLLIVFRKNIFLHLNLLQHKEIKLFLEVFIINQSPLPQTKKVIIRFSLLHPIRVLPILIY